MLKRRGFYFLRTADKYKSAIYVATLSNFAFIHSNMRISKCREAASLRSPCLSSGYTITRRHSSEEREREKGNTLHTMGLALRDQSLHQRLGILKVDILIHQSMCKEHSIRLTWKVWCIREYGRRVIRIRILTQQSHVPLVRCVLGVNQTHTHTSV